MDHREAIAYINSLDSLGIRPGLDRIRSLLARLGSPQDGFRSILIGGTNGKGSVAAFLSTILREAGFNAGIYTSPHMIDFEERIAIGDEKISHDDLASLTAEVSAAIDRERNTGSEQATYFEATTAIAFMHFARRSVPFAVLEVGMGGRFDATNVVTPIACAVTPITLDHTRWLGNTLEAIAFEKAGILKPGVPAVIARQAPEALEVIRSEATRRGAPLIATSDCRVETQTHDPRCDPPIFRLHTPTPALHERLEIGLRGDHQIENATVAVLLAESLASRGEASIDREAIARGLARTRWPGRLEIVPGEPEILLDGAHNAAGCEALAAYLERHQAGKRMVLVLATMRDKPATLMLRSLAPLVQEIFVTSIPGRRAAALDDLARCAASHVRRVTQEGRIADALRHARRAAGPDGLVVVSGSLYLVGEIKRILREE